MKIRDTGELKRANTLHIFFKKQTFEYLEEQSISICPECGGVGLSRAQIEQFVNNEHIWDVVSFYDKCKGIGFLGVRGDMQVDLLHYICRACKGDGCNTCNNLRIVDWLDHSMGR